LINCLALKSDFQTFGQPDNSIMAACSHYALANVFEKLLSIKSLLMYESCKSARTLFAVARRGLPRQSSVEQCVS